MLLADHHIQVFQKAKMDAPMRQHKVREQI